MDKLSKQQKDEYATTFAILALYDGGVSLQKGILSAFYWAQNNHAVGFGKAIFLLDMTSNLISVKILEIFDRWARSFVHSFF